jgi:hypothetical protein
MGKRVYSAARTDPLQAMIQERETQQRLNNLFTAPQPAPRPAPPVQQVHVHGRGVAFLAGCEGCQQINRAYYHAHKKAGTRPYKRKT